MTDILVAYIVPHDVWYVILINRGPWSCTASAPYPLTEKCEARKNLTKYKFQSGPDGVDARAHIGGPVNC